MDTHDEVRAHLKAITESVPFRTWAKVAPTDSKKVLFELAGVRRPSASSTYARALVGIARLFPPKVVGNPGSPPPAAGDSVLKRTGAVVANVNGDTAVDSARGKAFLLAGGKYVVVQFGDPTSEARNVAEIEAGWKQKWEGAGVTVLGWCRAEQVTADLGEYALAVRSKRKLSGWLFNTEQAHEVSRLHTALLKYRLARPSDPLGAILLGRTPGTPTGAFADTDSHLFYEAFPGEGDITDTVTQCWEWWRQAKVPADRLHPTLQGFGTHPAMNEQVIDANQVGARGVLLYLFESATSAEVAALGGLR